MWREMRSHISLSRNVWERDFQKEMSFVRVAEEIESAVDFSEDTYVSAKQRFILDKAQQTN